MKRLFGAKPLVGAKPAVGGKPPVSGGSVEPAVRTTGTTLVGLGAIAVLVGLLLPWARAGDPHPDVVTLGGIGFLGPLLSGTGLAMLRFEPARRRSAMLLGGAGAVAAAAIAVAVTAYVDPVAGIAVGGPLVAFGAGYAALGWLALGLTRPGPPAVGRSLLAVVAAVALLAVGGATGIRWYVDARFVDHHTVTASTVRAATPPAVLDTERWRRTVPGTGVIGVAGGDLVVADGPGVRAVDASSGEPRWHYLRTDLRLRAATLTGAAGATDRMVVAAFGTGDGVFAVALDVRTGEQRWAHRYAGAGLDPDRLLAAPGGPVVPSAGPGGPVAMVGVGPDAGDVVALDPRTGERRWTFQPRDGDDRCGVADAVAGSATFVVAVRCRANGIRDSVVALSAVDGTQQWRWNAEYGAALPAGADPGLASTGPGIVVEYGPAPRRALALDGATGRTGAAHTTAGRLVTTAGTTLVYLFAEPGTVEVSGFDATAGTVRWAASLRHLAGYRPVGAATHGDTAYLLMRGDQAMPGDQAMRVVGLDTGDGAVRVDREVRCAGPCADRPGALLVGPEVVIVADVRPDAGTVELTALG